MYSNYEKLLLTEDFNAEISDHHHSKTILYQYEMKSLSIEKTRFKSTSNSNCVGLLLADDALTFQGTETVSTGFLDLHRLVLAVLKTSIAKNKP